MMPSDILEKAKQDLTNHNDSRTIFADKLNRLKTDLLSLRDDIAFLNESTENRIIYVADYTEVLAYQYPEQNLRYYLYDIEEEDAVKPGKPLHNQKVVKRWYRSRELFFSEDRKTLILPAHWVEVEDDIAYLSQVLTDENVKLEDIIKIIKKEEIPEDEYHFAKELLSTMDKDKDYILKEAESNRLNEFFNKYTTGIASLTYNTNSKIEERIEFDTRFDRLKSLLKKGNIEDVQTLDWQKYASIDDKTAEKIKEINLQEHTDKIDQLMSLFSMISVKTKSTLSNYIDAQALVHIHEINRTLKDSGYDNVRMQMVSSSLTLFTINNVLPDDYICASVRHPKLLAGCLSARENIWKEIDDDQSNMVKTIEAFLDKYTTTSNFKKQAECAKVMRHEISEIWQRLEAVIFAKEVQSNKESNQPVILEQIKDLKKQKIVKDFMVFLRGEKATFNNFFHQTFKVGFEELVDVYVTKFLSKELDKFSATYFDDINTFPIPLRLRLDSPGIRNVIELYDRQIIERLKDGKNSERSFGLIVKDMMSNRVELRNEFEMKLIKALLLASAERWELVHIMCDYALEDKNKSIPHQEAYYLRHFAFRCLAFENLSESDMFKAKIFFKKALNDIQKANRLSLPQMEKDSRYILAEAAMILEYLCSPDLLPDRPIDEKQMNEILKKCDVSLKLLAQEKSKSFRRYMQARYYQILLSYYLADKVGMLSPVCKERIYEAKAKDWYGQLNNLIESDSDKLYKGLYVIRDSANLDFNFDSLTKEECISIFDNIYNKCIQMTEKRFFKKLTHAIKIYFKDRIILKYPDMKDEAKRKWPKLYSDTASGMDKEISIEKQHYR